MASLDLAFKLTANADGVAAGVAQADREMAKVGSSAKATAAEFRQAAKITSEMRTPAEKYADTVGRLDKMLQKGLLTQEVYGRAVAKAEKEMKAATSSMDEMAKKASIAERVINGTANAITNVATATKSIADAGVSVIKFGKDVAWTYVQWRALNAIRNPAGIKDFAIGMLKAAATARTMILAAKALGVGLAIGGGAMGTVAAAALGLSNPLIGATLLTLNLGSAFLNAKDRALEMAAGITQGTTTLAALNGQLGEVQAQQIDNLAFAMEEATAAGERSKSAFAGLGDVFVTPFVGAFAAITSGFAGLQDGLSGIIEGITSIASPIAQAIAPVFTLIGTVIEGVMKLAGVLGETVGVVLKLAGAFTQTLLSPVIVGLTNTVELIRGGMNAAFEYIGSKIDWATKKIQSFYAYMAKVPIIGRAFASGETPAAAAEGAQQAEAAAGAAQNAGFDPIEFEKSRRANEEAIATANEKAAKDKLNQDLALHKAQMDNEKAIAEANRKAAQDQLNQQLALHKTQMENEQAIRDAEMKRAEEAAKMDEKIAAKQAEIDKVNAEKAAALGGKSNEALKANDVRSGEGMAQFLALATGREDPAIEENRKTNAKLEEIRQELRALQQEKVEILGAAA